MTASDRTTLFSRTPATARTIFWAFVVATINFGIWALATHAHASPVATVTVAADPVAEAIDRVASNLLVTR